jgi:hypothetical protein
MIDEKDISDETQWYFEKLALKTVKTLKENLLNADYVRDRRDALSKVITMKRPGATFAATIRSRCTR